MIEGGKGRLLAVSTVVLNRLTEYCKDLYNIQLKTDASILQNYLQSYR